VSKQMIDIEKIMKNLAKNRPIFHSEADFQHAFAWEIQSMYPKSKIRLEYPYASNKGRIYLDLWVKDEPIYYAIELKYIKKNLNVTTDDEEYQLTSNDALDLARYDYVKDISRLEQVANHFDNTVGIVIMLTNEPALWKPPLREDVNDIQFRIHEGRDLEGRLDWGPKTGLGTRKGREPLSLQGKYPLNWKSYSNVETKNGEFRYLLVNVQKKGEA
jgi:hypothetical protein